MLGGQKAVFFVIWPGKGTAGKVFLYKIKKAPFWRKLRQMK